QGGTASPIKHLVVIFQENVSFDHYFGTYPKAANTSGEPFQATLGTPKVNGLANTPGAGGSGTLLTNNPNKDANGNQVNPQRYDPATINDVLTCDQDHGYGDEQKAFNGGAMDKFVTTVGTGSGNSPTGQPCNASDVMNYYDGNTTTGLWNYAQNFAMSDNSFNTTFGPSAPGALNLISGQTNGVGQMINGADTNAVHPVGAAIVGTGGVTPGPTNYGNKNDYIPHHEPFQYYASTANPHHLPPASLSAIGTDTQTFVNGVPQFNTANHQYDISYFN